MAAEGNEGFGALDGGAVHSLIELLGNDREALADIVDTFLEEAPQRLAELRQGIEAGNLELVGRAAHTLKANGRTFGATTMAELCGQIETAARSGDLEPASSRIDEVDAAWRSVQPDLAALGSDGRG